MIFMQRFLLLEIVQSGSIKIDPLKHLSIETNQSHRKTTTEQRWQQNSKRK